MAFARREGSNISGCHYLDGMPVKISEKFRPPRKITLPLSYQQRYPVDLLSEEYDFSLECQVLELAKTKRRGREVAERAKVEKLGTSIEEFTRMVCGETRQSALAWSNNTAAGNQDSQCLGKGSEDDFSARDNPDANDVGQPASDSKNGLVPAVGIATSLLTSLEPNSMLKPVPTTESHAVSDKPDVTLTNKFNIEDFEAESSPFDSVELKTLNDIEELKSVLQNAHLADSEYRLREGGAGHAQHQPQATPSKDLTVNARHSRHGKNGLPHESSKEAVQRLGCSNGGHYQPPRETAARSPPVTADYPVIPSTPTDSHSNATSETELSVGISKSETKLSPLSLNAEVDTEAQQLIDHIIDMGFPRARVTLVVENVGKDDKKVVEHLCLMQSFIERGYIPDHVEAGVLLNGPNEAQVKEYLEIMVQFRDLGFDDESIKKALVQCNYDREKALDFLLS